jgi:hypothetical protein
MDSKYDLDQFTLYANSFNKTQTQLMAREIMGSNIATVRQSALGKHLPNDIYQITFDQMVWGNGAGLLPWQSPTTNTTKEALNYEISRLAGINRVEKHDSFRGLRDTSHASVAVKTLSIGAPSKPANLYVKGDNGEASTKIVLAWDAIEMDFGGGDVAAGFIKLYYSKKDPTLAWNFCCGIQGEKCTEPMSPECTKVTGGTVSLDLYQSLLRVILLQHGLKQKQHRLQMQMRLASALMLDIFLSNL